MIQSLLLLCSLTGIAAFSVISHRHSRNSELLGMKYEMESGAIPPLNYFDPLGISRDVDEETFADYRAAELKHCRVAMLGVIGYIVPEIFKFPGNIAPGVAFASIPNGIAAIQAIPALGWLQILFLIGAVDYRGYLIFGDQRGSGMTDEQFEKGLNNELSNGRLAMVAMLELLRHDAQSVVGGMYAGDHLLTGLPFLYQ